MRISKLAVVGLALTLAICTVLALTGEYRPVPPGLGHLVVAPVIALPALRAQAESLRTRAGEKIAELVDGLSPEQIRAIEGEHDQILAELDTVKRSIEEAERAQPSPPPANGTPDEIAQRAVVAERERTNALADLARRSNAMALASEHIRSGTSVDAFRGILLDHLVSEERRAPSDSRVRIDMGNDNALARRAGMTEALSYRMGVQVPQGGPSEAARGFMGRGLIELAAGCIDEEIRGIPNARQIDEIYTRATHSTSDFPVIFGGAVNRTLEQRFALAQPTFKRFARRKNFRDFRPDKVVKIGDFPMLQKIGEGGEIKYGTFSEGAEQVQVSSYAIALRISRPMLVNDDLGAISDLLTSYGATVALFEEVTFYAQAFNGQLADGKSVFHADHGNLAAAGTVIDVANVGKGRAAMSKQKSKEGNPLLANSPKILLVGPDKLTEAEMLLTSITPATMSNVNIFSGRLEPVESSQLAGNAWHLLSSPDSGSNWRWGYLEGYEAPRVRFDEPFGQQGFAMSVEHDLGVGATDFRFGWKNPGA